MSLDFDLIIDMCPHCGRGSDSIDFNFTGNVVPMWYKAGVYDALYMSNCKSASEIVADLRLGVLKMESHPEEYKELDAENGWGTYDQALPWLKSVLAACEQHPKARISIWK